MNSKLFLLFKNNIVNTYKLKSTSTKKTIITLLLIVYVVGVLVLTLGTFLNKIYTSLEKLNLVPYYLVILFAIASLFAFVFSIFSAKSSLFDNKDNNLLLSLPIKRSDVLLSRLLMVMGYNFVVGLIFIIPGLFIYFSNNSVEIISLISIIVLTLCFSIIPTILASLFGYLIAILTSNSKSKSVMELIYYTLFIVLYMLVINGSNKIMMKLINNVSLLNNILKYLFLPIYLMLKGLTTNNILYILLVIVLNAICLFLFVFLLNKSYLTITSKLSSSKTSNKKYQMKASISSSVSKALLKKETKKYFSSAIYVFNTIFGMFFVAIAAIGSLFYSYDKMIEIAKLSGNNLNSFALVYLLLSFAITFTNTTNSSISIERDNFWIMKMIPVKTRDIFNAKLLLNRIIIIPITILSLGVFTISNYITPIEMVVLSIFAIIYAFFISNFGLIINLMFPKLDAISDNVIVKQSAASFVSIMGGMLLFIVLFFVSLQDGFTNILSVTIGIVIVTILFIVSEVIIKTWGEKKFLKIN